MHPYNNSYLPVTNIKFLFSLQAAAPYRICSALVPLKDANTLLAKATFTEGSVRGAIYFVGQAPFDHNL
jgi:hypothetical protein